MGFQLIPKSMTLDDPERPLRAMLHGRSRVVKIDEFVLSRCSIFVSFRTKTVIIVQHLVLDFC